MDDLKDQLEIEKYRYECQANLEKYKYDLQMGMENFKAVVAMGQTAIKGAFLANGAALIALMAFIANGWRGGFFTLPIHDLADAAIKFVLGLGFALAAQGISYLAQYAIAVKLRGSDTCGGIIGGVSSTLTGSSYAFLVWGGVVVWRVIEKIV